MKLFVWVRKWQPWQQFFAQGSGVQLSMLPGDMSCNGVWAAADDGQKGRLAQAVNGLGVATDARHGLPLVSANLVDSGERYGYALHLLVFYLRRCSQLHIDIMWPWLQRTLAASLQDPPADASSQLRAHILQLRQLVVEANSFTGVRKVLSHAHDTLHSLHCQVLWQPGRTPACAKKLGEQGEQLFSYWPKHAFATCNQSVAGADGQLTKGAFHFVRLKLQRQAALLVERCRKLHLPLHQQPRSWPLVTLFFRAPGATSRAWRDSCQMLQSAAGH